MTEEKANGKLAMNARINVKYGNKPKISFSYPDKDTQLKGSMFYPVKYLCLIIGIIMATPFYYFGLFSDFFSTQERLLGVIAFISLVYYILPLFVYFPFKKRWDKLYPKYQGLVAKKKLKVFTIKDLQERDGRIFVELPLFKNVVCDFKCQGEFSDYLEEIDIREYEFEYLRMKRFKINKKEVRKRQVNEWIWYARWYFNQKPKQGNMEVIFK
jgi:membrane-bound metal-dependent hydrolase YbcI (DUF457 family)